MHDDAVPPAVAIVGRKNSGKTTLLVAVAAELKRRGLRVATIKHGHHEMQIDEPGRDSWRHFHEGGAEATLLVAGARVALVERRDREPDPVELVHRFYAGRSYDLVLVEGYKHGPFPRIEVYRRALHDRPIHDPEDPHSGLLALVTDAPELPARCPVVPLAAAGAPGVPAHVQQLATLIERHLAAGRSVPARTPSP